MTGWLTFFLCIVLGYLFFLYLSHPQKKKNKIPKISIGRIDFLPNFRIHIDKKTYHFHHWLLLTLIIAVPVVIQENFPYPMMVRGLLIGGILQGLRYSDRFKFRYPREIEQFTEQISEQIVKELNQFNEKMKKPQMDPPETNLQEAKKD
ncbi:hypothetical protein M1349_04235 [Patescibacteria group bacterium]|nr:hypothetical protein [Patescibacteria group bacterium]